MPLGGPRVYIAIAIYYIFIYVITQQGGVGLIYTHNAQELAAPEDEYI